MSLLKNGDVVPRRAPDGLLSKCEVRDRFLTVFREYVHPTEEDGRVSPARVAAVLKVDVKTVHNWLRGDNLPSLEVTINLRRLFGADFVQRIYGDMVAVEDSDVESAAVLRNANKLARIARAVRELEVVSR